jgi:hypothetical protein
MPYLKNEPKPEIKMPVEPMPDTATGLRELSTTGHPTAKP